MTHLRRQADAWPWSAAATPRWVVEQVFVGESLTYNGVGMESDSRTAQAVQLDPLKQQNATE